MRRTIQWTCATAICLTAMMVLWPQPSPARLHALPAEPAAVEVKVYPGLVVEYREDGKKPATYTTIESAIGFQLAAGESPHPNLNPDRFAANWQGHLKITRKAEYRFRAIVLGQFELKLDKEVVLTGGSKNPDKPEMLEGKVTLAPGSRSLAASFTRSDKAARLQVFWKADHFHEEPVPHDSFSHPLTVGIAGNYFRDWGRLLVEEHSCTACHLPKDTSKAALALQNRKGPDLSNVGEWLKPDWIEAWVLDPKALRPHAAMPKLLSEGDDGLIEAHAIAKYLSSLGTGKPAPDKAKPEEVRASVTRGERLFSSIGCAACHSSPKAEKPDPLLRSLKGADQRTSVDQLAKYLLNPLAIDPKSRMPHMLLTAAEATDIARFLISVQEKPLKHAKQEEASALRLYNAIETRKDERAEFAKLPAEDQWKALGKRLVIERSCNACHTIAPGGKPFAQVMAKTDFEQLMEKDIIDVGCLKLKGKAKNAPAFSFTMFSNIAIEEYLSKLNKTQHFKAPIYEARADLVRFNCLACHTRDGQGGLSIAMIDDLRKFENAENAEAVSPPPLTGIGGKLTTGWMKQVLTQGGRARPWMALRMPQFGTANVGHLAEGLTACDGELPLDVSPAPEFKPSHIEIGRKLVGKQSFGCIACHDIAGNAAAGTRGPDLASMNQRVRYDWYRRWLEQPQKMQPGTRMPSIFSDGKSQIDDILKGDADAQAAAMWNYLALGKNLPLPDGVEPPKGLVLAVKDRTIVLRTFMPDAGNKAVAVGYPDGVSVAFDAATCRLAYGWSGNFLDVSPVWNDRGGAPAKLLGPRFWQSPNGFPWAFSKDDKLPNFAEIAKDPAYGATLPEGKVFTGAMKLHYEGHSLDKEGRPSFKYKVDVGEKQSVEIIESIMPMRRPTAVGLTRIFAVGGNADQLGWLLAGESTEPPKILTAKGEERAYDFKDGPVSVASECVILLKQPGDRVILLRLTNVPKDTAWHLVKEGNGHRVYAKLPKGDGMAVSFGLTIWQPYRPDAKLIQELITGEMPK